MKKFLVLFSLILNFVYSIQAQQRFEKNEKEEVSHPIYGKAIVEKIYDAKDVLRTKIIYTRDTLFTKENQEIGEMMSYSEKGNLEIKGSYIRKGKRKDFFGNIPKRKETGEWSFYKDGKLIQVSNFKEGIMDGGYVLYHPNGEISQKGIFVKGQKEGLDKLFFNNGQLYISIDYKVGKPYNVISCYNKNGVILNYGTFKNGTGSLKFYNTETGKFIQTYTYENGVSENFDIKIIKTDKGNITKKTYKNNDGSIREIKRILNDELEGVQEFYNSKGKVSKRINYYRGKKNGKEIAFNNDGTLLYEYTYKNDKKIGSYKMMPSEGIYNEEYVLNECVYDEEEKQTGKFIQYSSKISDVLASNGKDYKRVIIASGEFKKNIKVGVWKYYNKKGELKRETNFSNKNIYINKEYFDSTKILEKEVNYDIEKDVGVQRLYYYKGQLKNLISYKYKTLDGKYRDNKLKEIWKDKDVLSITGFYSDDQERIIMSYKYKILDGKYEEYYENNQLKEIGEYKNDNKIGNWKIYNKDGLILKDYIYSDVGNSWAFKTKDYKYDTGRLLSVIVKDSLTKNENGYSLINSLHKYYNIENGKLKQKITYKNGNKHGAFEEYYLNGKLKQKITYKNGNKHGVFEEYYLNGKLKLAGSYVDGFFEDEWKYYHKNGKIEQEGFYLKGKRKGTWKFYNEKGKVIERKKYK